MYSFEQYKHEYSDLTVVLVVQDCIFFHVKTIRYFDKVLRAFFARLLTFVFVAFGFDTQAGDNHDDNNDHNSGQTHQKPIFAVKRFGSIIPGSQVPLGRSGYLWKKARSLFSSRQLSFFSRAPQRYTKDRMLVQQYLCCKAFKPCQIRKWSTFKAIFANFASFKNSSMSVKKVTLLKKCIGQSAIKWLKQLHQKFQLSSSKDSKRV